MFRRLVLPLLATSFLSACATQGTIRDAKVSEEVFVVQASMNGFTPSVALKPATISRAQALAKQHGFEGFDIEAVNILYSTSGTGYSSSTSIKMHRAVSGVVPGMRYVASAPPGHYANSASGLNIAALARLDGYQARNEKAGVIWIKPAFVDAVAGERSAMDGSEVAYLAPGRHVIIAHAWVVASFFSDPQTALLRLDADLVAGGRYRFDVKVAAQDISVSIVDTTSNDQVAQARSVLRRAP